MRLLLGYIHREQMLLRQVADWCTMHVWWIACAHTCKIILFTGQAVAFIDFCCDFDGWWHRSSFCVEHSFQHVPLNHKGVSVRYAVIVRLGSWVSERYAWPMISDILCGIGQWLVDFIICLRNTPSCFGQIDALRCTTCRHSSPQQCFIVTIQMTGTLLREINLEESHTVQVSVLIANCGWRGCGVLVLLFKQLIADQFQQHLASSLSAFQQLQAVQGETTTGPTQ